MTAPDPDPAVDVPNRPSSLTKSSSMPHFWYNAHADSVDDSRVEIDDLPDTEHIVEEALDSGSTLVEHGLMIVLDSKVNIFSKMTETAEGQDKIFKFFSGINRIAIDWVTKLVKAANKSPYHILLVDILSRLTSLRKATSICRKFLKLFNIIIFIRLIWRVYMFEKFGVLKVVVLGRLLGLWLYFLMNYMVWACKVKILKRSSEPYTRIGLCGYLFSIIFTFILDFGRYKKNYNIRKNLQADLDDLKSSSPDANMSQRQKRNAKIAELTTDLKDQDQMAKQLQLNTIKNVFDTLGGSSFLFGWNFSEQLLGVLQSTSAFIALQRLWRQKALDILNLENAMKK